jgi:hypothetical protein
MVSLGVSVMDKVCASKPHNFHEKFVVRLYVMIKLFTLWLTNQIFMVNKT